PNVNFFGPNAVNVTAERAQLLNMKKPLIVTDTFLKDLEGGPVKQVISLLNDENIGHAIYDGVEPNPKIANCLDGMKVYNENKCDGIITIGGGSSHDCGKGIGIAATHDGDLTDYAGIETLTNELPPIIAVNTTAGTGSEVPVHWFLRIKMERQQFELQVTFEL